jgi:endonuclease YncB( thermonuclease family)
MRTRAFTSSFLLSLLMLLPTFALGAELVGKVVRVIDGENLVIRDVNNTPTKVHLASIDCPEKGQPWGSRAREALAGYTFAKEVTVDWDKRDQGGWTVGTVIVDGTNVNLALVSDGMCWWYRKYADEQSPADRLLFKDAETKAREDRRGLWSDADPTPPWEWRGR